VNTLPLGNPFEIHLTSRPEAHISNTFGELLDEGRDEDLASPRLPGNPRGKDQRRGRSAR
jgi:hypothetical protein